MVRGAWLCGPQSHVHGCQPGWKGLSLGSDGPLAPRTEADALWVIEVQCSVVSLRQTETGRPPFRRHLRLQNSPCVVRKSGDERHDVLDLTTAATYSQDVAERLDTAT